MEAPGHYPTIIIGDGWAALGAAAACAQAGKRAIWLSGSGSRLLSPLPAVESGPGARAWRTLLRAFNIECGDGETGVFLREFRNRSFARPVWAQRPDPLAGAAIRDRDLWAPERRFAGLLEVRFDRDLGSLETELRAAVLAHPAVERVECGGVLPAEVRWEAGGSGWILLASGESLGFSRLVYADRWSDLRRIKGMPDRLAPPAGKELAAAAIGRTFEPMGAVQAVFAHASPPAGPVAAAGFGFYCALARDAGQEFDRHAWGYFLQPSGGAVIRSAWTVYLAPEESEDNHEVMKRLRKIKQTLNRAFVGEEWVPEGCREFTDTITGEQIRLGEALVFAKGEALERPATARLAPGAVWLTDGFGPARAFEQVSRVPGLEAVFSPPGGDAGAQGCDRQEGGTREAGPDGRAFSSFSTPL